MFHYNSQKGKWENSIVFSQLLFTSNPILQKHNFVWTQLCNLLVVPRPGIQLRASMEYGQSPVCLSPPWPGTRLIQASTGGPAEYASVSVTATSNNNPIAMKKRNCDGDLVFMIVYQQQDIKFFQRLQALVAFLVPVREIQPCTTAPSILRWLMCATLRPSVFKR